MRIIQDYTHCYERDKHKYLLKDLSQYVYVRGPVMKFLKDEYFLGYSSYVEIPFYIVEYQYKHFIVWATREEIPVPNNPDVITKVMKKIISFYNTRNDTEFVTDILYNGKVDYKLLYEQLGRVVEILKDTRMLLDEEKDSEELISTLTEGLTWLEETVKISKVLEKKRGQ